MKSANDYDFQEDATVAVAPVDSPSLIDLHINNIDRCADRIIAITRRLSAIADTVAGPGPEELSKASSAEKNAPPYSLPARVVALAKVVGDLERTVARFEREDAPQPGRARG